MSVSALTWSFNAPLRGLALKGVLNALADHADPQGRCWPSIDRLARYAGCDAKTARKALRDLETLGALKRQARPGRSDLFELQFAWQPEGEDKAAPLPELAGVPKVAPLPELAVPPLPELGGDPSQSWYPNRQEPSFEPPVESAAADEAFDLYVSAAKHHHWVVPRKLDPDRRKALIATLKEWGGLDAWREALTKAAASDFIMGRIKRTDEHANWRCDLDFLLKPKRFRRLMEGGYGGTVPPAAMPQRGSWAAGQP
ncbi:helix-turn-helix domain-containing protein [Reyranella sp.]|jgi:hypothetical protein|uniref:helix-turn-helix domain-containing protein n=1 Tax=Reyranella sp. TaxID=1929291 RepID=UPI002608AFEF|nr:helix-turn-helix domain-containing protein [Reyranella sp.]